MTSTATSTARAEARRTAYAAATATAGQRTYLANLAAAADLADATAERRADSAERFASPTYPAPTDAEARMLALLGVTTATARATYLANRAEALAAAEEAEHRANLAHARFAVAVATFRAEARYRAAVGASDRLEVDPHSLAEHRAFAEAEADAARAEHRAHLALLEAATLPGLRGLGEVHAVMADALAYGWTGATLLPVERFALTGE